MESGRIQYRSRRWQLSRRSPTKAHVQVSLIVRVERTALNLRIWCLPVPKSVGRGRAATPHNSCHLSSWKLLKGKESRRATEWRLPMPFDCFILLQSWSFPPFESPLLNSSMLTSVVLMFVFFSFRKILHVFISLPHKPTQVRTTHISLADASLPGFLTTLLTFL